MAKKPNPRHSKSGRRCPAQSAVLKALWAKPEYREKMIGARQCSAEDRRANPQKYSRRGVPNGMRKPEAMKAWDTARALAGTIMTGFEAQGIVPAKPIPDSDEEKAKLALHEACVLALAPGNMRTKLSAAATVLRYTKAPPVRSHATPNSAAEWLSIAADAAVTNSTDNVNHHAMSDLAV
jgi:hypothetical protein